MASSTRRFPIYFLCRVYCVTVKKKNSYFVNSEGIIFSFMSHMLPPHLNAGHVVITTINLVSMPFSLVAQYTTFHLFVLGKTSKWIVLFWCRTSPSRGFPTSFSGSLSYPSLSLHRRVGENPWNEIGDFQCLLGRRRKSWGQASKGRKRDGALSPLRLFRATPHL